MRKNSFARTRLAFRCLSAAAMLDSSNARGIAYAIDMSGLKKARFVARNLSNSYVSHRNWRQSGNWPVALRTTLTTYLT